MESADVETWVRLEGAEILVEEVVERENAKLLHQREDFARQQEPEQG